MTSRTYYHFRMPCQALCKNEHALRACGLGAGGVWDCFAATTLAAHPAGRRCASGQSPLPLCCAKCPERGRRALSPFGAAPPSSSAALGIPAKGWLWRRGGVACHRQTTPMTPERAKAVPCRHGAESQLQTKMPSVKPGIFSGRSLTAMEKCRPLSQKQTKCRDYCICKVLFPSDLLPLPHSFWIFGTMKCRPVLISELPYPRPAGRCACPSPAACQAHPPPAPRR